MGFAPGCARAPAGRSSSAAVKRDAGDSPRSGRPYVPLRGRDAVRRAYRSTRRRRSGDVVVVSTEGAPGPPQVGVVAGKRIGNAVIRNRVKRRLREAMAQVALDEDTAYLVIAGPEAAGVEFRRLVEWLGEAVASGRDAVEAEDD